MSENEKLEIENADNEESLIDHWSATHKGPGTKNFLLLISPNKLSPQHLGHHT